MIYKLTFFDKVSIPFCSSTVSFFTDSPESFEQCYFYRSTTAQDDKQVRTLDNEDQYKRYQRSKNGEMVTDYYCNLPELNIFQYDETSKIQLLKEITLQPRKANPEDFYYRSDFPKEMLKNDWLETCCWLPITESPDLLTLEDLPEDYMNILMRDILGEAG